MNQILVQAKFNSKVRNDLISVLRASNNLYNYPEFKHISELNITLCQSKRPRRLRHEMSSPTQNTSIVGSNPNRDIDVCVYSVFVFFYVVAALRWAYYPSKESYRLSIVFKFQN
jgi:hypothetical protein